MIISRTLTRLARVGAAATALAAGLAGGAAVLAPAPASAGNASGSGASCSGSSCTVLVTFTGTAAPPSGSAKASAYVAPDCWYEPAGSPAEFLAKYRAGTEVPHYSGIQSYATWGSAAEINAAAEDPTLADHQWYMMRCRDGINVISDPIAHEYAGETINYAGDEWTIVSLLLPPGVNPPPPPVDIETLRDAAREAMTIPEPTVAHNPTLTELGGATLVNFPTWFSAGPAYADSFYITASVGPVSATVTAAEPSWTLSSPAGGATCTQAQMTADLTATTPDPCALEFSRASAGIPVDVTSTWQTSWSGVPEPAGPIALDTISATSGTVVPVVQSQSLVTPNR